MYVDIIERVLTIEGDYVHHPADRGGQTYRGIARAFWPQWEGWSLVEQWLSGGDREEELNQLVLKFYHEHFWQRIRGDALAAVSPRIAEEVLEAAINCGVSSAVRFLQTALQMNMDSILYPTVVDGVMGPKTLHTFTRYMSYEPIVMNEQILLNCLNGEQYCFYKANPKHKVFRGWFLRT